MEFQSAGGSHTGNTYDFRGYSWGIYVLRRGGSYGSRAPLDMPDCGPLSLQRGHSVDHDRWDGGNDSRERGKHGIAWFAIVSHYGHLWCLGNGKSGRSEPGLRTVRNESIEPL